MVDVELGHWRRTHVAASYHGAVFPVGVLILSVVDAILYLFPFPIPIRYRENLPKLQKNLQCVHVVVLSKTLYSGTFTMNRVLYANLV